VTRQPGTTTAAEVMDWLRAQGSPEGVAGLARYGIPGEGAFGVPMAAMLKRAKAIGTDHALARALWAEAAYEARTMAVLVADPAALTPGEMDAWCAEFDTWAICDTACFRLFDRSPHAWAKAAAWSGDPREYVRRAGFALVWALSVHDRTAPDAAFLDALARVEAHAADDRPMVEKGIDMALRATGKRNPALRAAALATAGRLAAHPAPSARRIARHAFRELRAAPPPAATRR
jgi:3-methyladenine DNA glycosylase AlkD